MSTPLRTGRMRRDTRTILRVSGIVDGIGVFFAVVVWLTGGMTVHGPKNNLGWLALVIALGCVPTGTFFLLLGIAKWMNDRKRLD